MGYANRVVTLTFDDLSDDPADRIWITIRNPKLVPPAEMQASTKNVVIGPDGQPVQDEESAHASYSLFAKLIVGWHVYDASVVPELDDAGNVTGEQVLLTMPATAEKVAKLPMEIFAALGDELAKANPQKLTAAPEDGTSTTS